MTLSNDAAKFVGGVGGFFAAIPLCIPLARSLDLTKASSAALLGGSFVAGWIAIAVAVWLLWRAVRRVIVGRNVLQLDRVGVVRRFMHRAHALQWRDITAVETRDVLHESARSSLDNLHRPNRALRAADRMTKDHWVIVLCGPDSEIEIRSLNLVDRDAAHELLTRWCKDALGLDLGDPKVLGRYDCRSGQFIESAPGSPEKAQI